MEEEMTQLWWAGKELLRGKKLEDFVGRNEKTKIVAKLQKKGGGAPGREPVFGEEEQKKMMAYAYRRQEEMKVWVGGVCMSNGVIVLGACISSSHKVEPNFLIDYPIMVVCAGGHNPNPLVLPCIQCLYISGKCAFHWSSVWEIGIGSVLS